MVFPAAPLHHPPLKSDAKQAKFELENATETRIICATEIPLLFPKYYMKHSRMHSSTISEDEARSLTDFIMFSQRNLILRLSPELTQGRVSYPQFFLLAYLEEEECLSMSSIAHMMGHSTAAATGMVDKLEELGHLKRFTAAADRRKIMVRITQQGKDLVARMRQNITRDLASIMAQEEHAPVKKARRIISSKQASQPTNA